MTQFESLYWVSIYSQVSTAIELRALMSVYDDYVYEETGTAGLSDASQLFISTASTIAVPWEFAVEQMPSLVISVLPTSSEY